MPAHWSRLNWERVSWGHWETGGCWTSSDLQQGHPIRTRRQGAEGGTHQDAVPVSRLDDEGDGGCSVCGRAGDMARVCSSSSATARRVCPRERATARGRRPSESGMPRAELFQL